MKKLMSSRRPHRPAGDTLIEVLFAFTILSAVISVAFSGALSSYKSAQTAQNRTQALFLAQYQADALKTYRDSLAWDSTENNLASFKDGPTVIDKLTAMSTTYLPVALNTQGAPFCMGFVQDVTYWHINSNPYCDSFAKTLAPNLNSPTMQITLSAITNDSIKATVTVSYKAANNSAITEKVTNTILLTKQR
ncbi:MAG: hypothetical protein WCN86_03525 [bacterium]